MVEESPLVKKIKESNTKTFLIEIKVSNYSNKQLRKIINTLKVKKLEIVEIIQIIS